MYTFRLAPPLKTLQKSYLDCCRGGLNDDVTSIKAMIMLAFSVSISWVFAKYAPMASGLLYPVA